MMLPYLLYGRDNIGIALHTGMHYDVGNLSALPGAQITPQINIIVGTKVKADIWFAFVQLGIQQSFLASEGRVINDSWGTLKKTSIQYMSFPLYGGLNFPVRDRGTFYIGVGGAWILGSGYIQTATSKKNLNQVIFSHGFMTGMQIRLWKRIGLYFEWEYLYARTGPVINTDSAHNWKDFSADFSGHRFHCGVFYYVK